MADTQAPHNASEGTAPMEVQAQPIPAPDSVPAAAAAPTPAAAAAPAPALAPAAAAAPAPARRLSLGPFGSTDDHKEIQVGEQYQADVVPLMTPGEAAVEALPDQLVHPRRVWSVSGCPLSQQECNAYVQQARAASPYTLSIDQALGVLHWCKYDQESALSLLKEYMPHPDLSPSWSHQERAAFDAAFNQYGKRFHKIAARLPGKSTRNVVQYYYRWKVTKRSDKRVDKHKQHAPEPAPPRMGDDAVAHARRQRRVQPNDPRGSVCQNCGSVDAADEAPLWMLRPCWTANVCHVCAEFWKSWGRDRPVGDWHGKGHKPQRSRVDPQSLPSFEDVRQIFVQPQSVQSTHVTLDANLRDLDDLDQVYLAHKQMQLGLETRLRAVLPKLSELSGHKRSRATPGNNGPKGGPKPKRFRSGRQTMWPPEQIKIVIEGLKRFGKNFEHIASFLADKTPAQVRNFWNNHRRRYQLDKYPNFYEKQGIEPPPWDAAPVKTLAVADTGPTDGAEGPNSNGVKEEDESDDNADQDAQQTDDSDNQSYDGQNNDQSDGDQNNDQSDGGRKSEGDVRQGAEHFVGTGDFEHVGGVASDVTG